MHGASVRSAVVDLPELICLEGACHMNVMELAEQSQLRTCN